MDLLKIDENLTLEELDKKHKKSKFWLIFKNVLFLFLIAFLISIFLLSNIAAYSQTKFATTIKKNPLINQISHLISSETKKLKGEKEGRTNILLLGYGGEGHDGPLLTDTIILLSYNYETKETAIVSIPRDMVVKTDNNTYKKINNLYSIGEYSGNNQGLAYTKDIISKNIGIPVHYAVAIDFFGFEEIINALGGVDVTVDNSFVDYMYPTENHKYQTVKFEKGDQHLNGERALQFARSRHGMVTGGTGFEGSDFARSERQFKIIKAVKDKVLSFSTLSNPQKVIKLFKILQNYITTDAESWEAMRFIETLRSMNQDNIYKKVLSDAPDSLLTNTTSAYDGAFILIPRNNNYNLITSFFQNIFNTEGAAKEEQKIEKEQSNIYILNGTKTTGLASTISNKLKAVGLEIQKTDNSPRQDASTTVIYDLSKNKNPETLKTIQSTILGARSTVLPDYLKDYENDKELDFLIVLGEDQLLK